MNSFSGTTFITVNLVSAVLFAMLSIANAQGVDGPSILQGLNTSDRDIRNLEQGGVLVFDSTPYENSPRDLAADAAVLVDSELHDVLSHFETNISFVPNDEMLAHAEIRSDEDFAGVMYNADDYEEVEKLVAARRGKDFNFSDEEYAQIDTKLARFRKADPVEKIAAASDLMRLLLLGRYHAYKQGGLGAIAPYSRSSRKKVSAGDELRITSETFAPFENEFPGYYHSMVGYPSTNDQCCKHEFRWLKVKIRDRPIFALAHTMYQLTDDFLIVTERFFYLTSQANSLQITLAWLPYDHDTYMALSMSANADILGSMLGRMLKKLGRNKAQEFVTDALTQVRTELGDPVE